MVEYVEAFIYNVPRELQAMQLVKREVLGRLQDFHGAMGDADGCLVSGGRAIWADDPASEIVEAVLSACRHRHTAILTGMHLWFVADTGVEFHEKQSEYAEKGLFEIKIVQGPEY